MRLKPGLYHFGRRHRDRGRWTPSRHKKHTLYYYQDENLLLGFDKIFESYKALQGTTLVFEQTAADEFQFTVKTTKKGAITDKIVYDAEKKMFVVSGDKVASTVALNKSIFLEAEVFHTLAERMEEFRKIETYNKLFHKIFLEFGGREKNYEIHILRLYHILDLIAPVDLKLVEEVILSNPEFIPAEKLAGVFYLDSDAVVEIEEEEKDAPPGADRGPEAQARRVAQAAAGRRAQGQGRDPPAARGAAQEARRGDVAEGKAAPGKGIAAPRRNRFRRAGKAPAAPPTAVRAAGPQALRQGK